MTTIVRSILVVGLYLISMSAIALAAGVPELDLAQLITQSDFVVLGHLDDIHSKKRGTVGCSASVSVGQCDITISITDVLKGSEIGSQVTVSFSTPDRSWGFKHISEAGGEYGVFFLKRSTTGFAFSNPYYPFLPAIVGTSTEGSNVEERVLHQLAAFLQEPSASSRDKERLLFMLQTVDSPILLRALENSLNTSDPTLRLSVAGALIQRNDLLPMDIVVDALVRNSYQVPPYVLQNLSASIGRGLRSEMAIPFLATISSQATSAESRRAAMRALRATGSSEALAPLSRGLKDPDSVVRYYAVIGLADIANQPNWRPQLDQFRQKEDVYLSHWQSWAIVNEQPTRAQ